nr:anti-sigma F factor [bacterium]
MNTANDMMLEVPAYSENESFVRAAVGAFAVRLNPTVEELADIKTAVSEAMTNAVVHAYPKEAPGRVIIRVRVLAGNVLCVEIEDNGCGIADVEKARTPFYTTGPVEERAGMGFVVMETFMDEVEVFSAEGRGTLVRMIRRIGAGE